MRRSATLWRNAQSCLVRLQELLIIYYVYIYIYAYAGMYVPIYMSYVYMHVYVCMCRSATPGLPSSSNARYDTNCFMHSRNTPVAAYNTMPSQQRERERACERVYLERYSKGSKRLSTRVVQMPQVQIAR